MCSCHGLLTYHIREYSFTGEAFADFLKDVRGACGDEDVVHLFLDGCSIHKSKECRPLWGELNINPVRNVAYSPQYNAAVERYWSQLKAKFRPLLLSYMLANLPKHINLVRRALVESICKTG